ncbi:MAG: rRNA pseudouridine synthase [Oscillospiraceae bacterium]|jgi:23S rRNA pseudouridine2605 synthase|nr:rRNA pseudouridine synthase [Oscillospiraceae bacterium]
MIQNAANNRSQPPKGVRLQKFISECGVASRRKAEELIIKGRVLVNGKPAALGDRVNPKTDKVSINGKRLIADKNYVYIMLHKPRGYVTTLQDEMGRKCVAELVSSLGVRVYPVGRLDRESEGLLIMTNDGAFANALMHPSAHVPKTYRVTVRPQVTDEQITALCGGVMIDGRITAPAEVHLLEKQQEGRAVLEIILYEGRNRQIRKMCEELGLEVARLKRTAVGQVKLGMLKRGDFRSLNEKELRSLQTIAKAKGALEE